MGGCGFPFLESFWKNLDWHSLGIRKQRLPAVLSAQLTAQVSSRFTGDRTVMELEPKPSLGTCLELSKHPSL